MMKDERQGGIATMLAVVAGKRLPINRIIAFWSETRVVFPYLKITNPYKITREFPYIKRWLLSTWINKKTNDFLIVEMDNKKRITKRFKDGHYPSSIYCSNAIGELSGNYR